MGVWEGKCLCARQRKRGRKKNYCDPQSFLLGLNGSPDVPNTVKTVLINCHPEQHPSFIGVQRSDQRETDISVCFC